MNPLVTLEDSCGSEDSAGDPGWESLLCSLGVHIAISWLVSLTIKGVEELQSEDGFASLSGSSWCQILLLS